ncbi:hypothetical protein KL912_001844 [Ogataea haglerorum]|nr:hypothetical protein KL912_001844 [Ogataea haglerorum]
MPYVVRMPISAAGMRERFLYMFICRHVIVGIPSQIIWQQNAAPAVAWLVKCWLEFSPSNTRRRWAQKMVLLFCLKRGLQPTGCCTPSTTGFRKLLLRAHASLYGFSNTSMACDDHHAHFCALFDGFSAFEYCYRVRYFLSARPICSSCLCHDAANIEKRTTHR